MIVDLQLLLQSPVSLALLVELALELSDLGHLGLIIELSNLVDFFDALDLDFHEVFVMLHSELLLLEELVTTVGIRQLLLGLVELMFEEHVLVVINGAIQGTEGHIISSVRVQQQGGIQESRVVVRSLVEQNVRRGPFLRTLSWQGGMYRCRQVELR